MRIHLSLHILYKKNVYERTVILLDLWEMTHKFRT